MKKQITLFLTALMFYTRIPVPKNIDHSSELLNRSTKYFPLIGWIVGFVASISFYLFNLILPLHLSVLLSMAATILLTGAFHEDGFADTCDAFGGGWTKEKILEIMKDSRIGTYGTVGLLLILLSKFFSITSISVYNVPFAMFVAHSLSRYTATGMIYFSEYARADASSKTKPVGKSLTFGDNLIAFIFGITPLLVYSYLFSYWYILITLTIVPTIFFLKRYFEKWIGGFTGDGLGATQQLSEVIIYLSILIISNFI